MARLKIREITKITNGELITGNEEDEVLNYTRNSKDIPEEGMFLAFKGEKLDGNDFCSDAIQNGVKSCLASKIDDKTVKLAKEKNIDLIKVDDVNEAVIKMATYIRSKINIPVVAITGSVGKTSTKDLISSVLGEKYTVHKTKGNMNNLIGLPLTILKLRDEQCLVTEMGMNHFGEIRRLTNIAKPTLAVITNIGTSHIGNLGSRENILKAKLEILEGLQGNTIIINNDDDLLHKWYLENKEKYNIITIGIKEKGSTYVAENIVSTETNSTFTLKTNDGRKQQITISIGGEHFIINSLCAIAVGDYYKIPLEKIAEGIQKTELTKQRMEIIKAKNGATIINDTYNANYDSMTAALKYLQEAPSKRKIAILGDMLELGDYSKEYHEKIGKELYNVDILITVGNEAKYIDKNANVKEKYHFDNNNGAISKIKDIIKSDDLVLVKASNSMKFIDIVNELAK